MIPFLMKMKLLKIVKLNLPLKKMNPITITSTINAPIQKVWQCFTDMAKGEGLFWVAPVEKAAQQILNAIQRKKKIVYVTKRWRFIGFLLKIMPYAILKKL